MKPLETILESDVTSVADNHNNDRFGASNHIQMLRFLGLGKCVSSSLFAMSLVYLSVLERLPVLLLNAA